MQVKKVAVVQHSFRSAFEWPILYAFGRNIRQKISNFAVLQNGSNALAITATDEVYAIGHNGVHVPLGIGTTSRALKGVEVTELSGQGVCGILGGNDTHIVALTESGNVYSWGRNKYFVINTEEDVVKTPQLLSLPGKVVMVVIGAQHTVILTEEGLVYSWGDNSLGQLGIGNINATSTPTLVKGDKYIYISCGLFTSYFVNTTGEVYSTGCGRYGALGNGNTDNVMTSVMVTIPAAIKMVLAGKYTAYSVSTDNELYSWGCNTKGQIGNGELDNELTPTLVGKFSNVAAHFDCDTAAGIHLVGSTIYVWGDTRFGVITEPTITHLSSLADVFTVYINSRTYSIPVNSKYRYIIEGVEGAVKEEKPPLEVLPVSSDDDDTDNVPEPDLIIWVGARGKVESMIHQETLFKRSYFFNSLLLNKLITMETKEIVIPSCSSDTFQSYLDFIEDGNIDNPLITQQSINDLFHFAWSYREWSLIYYLINKYQYRYTLPYEYDPLTVDNVCLAYEDGLKANNKIFCDNCIVFIANNLLEVIISDYFLYDITCATMRSIMQALAEKQLLNDYNAIFNVLQNRFDDGWTCILEYPEDVMFPSRDEVEEVRKDIMDGEISENDVLAKVREINTVSALKKRKGIKRKRKIYTCQYLIPPGISYLFQNFN